VTLDEKDDKKCMSPSDTKEKILQKGKELSNYYGFDIHWE